jgi:PTS system fructose-specific IIC component
MVPILGAYVAYAIADRPGLAPGFILSYLVQQPDVLVTTAEAVGLYVNAASMGAGYLGALVTGLLVGHVARWVCQRSVPSALEPLLPVFLAPIVTTALLAPVVFVLGIPLAVANAALTTSLASLSGVTAVGVGAVLGAMVAFDLGGPVNKVAYVLAVGSVTEFVYGPMAAVMVAGMTPPLGLALSHALSPEKYELEAETYANRAVPMGLSFVTEGALPYAVNDPLRVIPSAMVGSAVAAAAVMGLGVTMPAPHGGLFVLLLSNKPLVFFGCLGAGTGLTAAAATVLKSPVSKDDHVVETDRTPSTSPD